MARWTCAIVGQIIPLWVNSFKGGLTCLLSTLITSSNRWSTFPNFSCRYWGTNVDGPVPPLVDQQLAWGSPGATGCQHRTCQAVDSRLHCKESKYVFIRFFKTRGKSTWKEKSQSFNVKSLPKNPGHPLEEHCCGTNRMRTS